MISVPLPAAVKLLTAQKPLPSFISRGFVPGDQKSKTPQNQEKMGSKGRTPLVRCSDFWKVQSAVP